MMIRKADMRDMPELMRMLRGLHRHGHLERYEAWEESKEYLQGLLTTCLEEKDRTVLVSGSYAGPHGFLAAALVPSLWSPRIRVAMEMFIWVDEEHRGHGYGNMLVDEFEEWARRAGAHFAMLGHGFQGDAAGLAALAQSHGFEPDETYFIKELR